MTYTSASSRPDRLTPLLGWATVLSLLATLALGLGAPADQNQGVLVRLLFIHVPSAWLSYLAYFGTGLFGLLYLLKRDLKFDRLALASAELGVLFTISTLVGGMLWAKPTWGAYWVWDARLTTTALSLVIYGGYLLIRSLTDDRDRRARVAAVIGLMGTLYVPVNYMAVEWWRGVHQTQTLKLLGNPDFAASPIYGWILTVGVVAFTFMYLYLLRVRAKVAELADAREEDELLAELPAAQDLEVARGAS
ncbi:cytochrome c biogenesis protein CcsA [Deinococcus sp. Marseille-Q6407]|uniref:cytochrome c biogenesis protein CcsA n=1 Tax=Deinococcus sp. Marseille-Q6407 TaxID=2969223 RepID=UPI0021C2187F|nr:cytochrome c biogenesis protein CcsA [Deinococcus sp. Marseille-Q6407]